ncbi:MAG: diaminopimelate decarboxylase [Rhodospirillaceae bacterium]|jgi:diaminopimelate decarboxylase|nr:diaminopimelate decarboxylase [Rhodospirillaceae bacterium]
MDHFQYRDGKLHAEGVALDALAQAVGTPFYCYSTATLERHYKVFEEAIAGLNAGICYAIKANSNIAVLATLGRLGAGADVVSGGEMERALAAGIAADKIVFSGVGKTGDELHRALAAGVTHINVESFPELDILSAAAEATGRTANVAIRINPDVDAKTHEKISTGRQEDKFGIDLALARDAYARAAELPGLNVCGVAMHIGSQLTDLTPYREAYSRMAEFVGVLRADGFDITHLDMGGGLGITYGDEVAPTPEAYGTMVAETVGNLGCRLTFEPGRMISGNAGILVTRVIFVKEGLAKRFCIVDGAMNDLIRPTLYSAHHEIVPVSEPENDVELLEMDVVGPICESGDFIAKDRALPPLGSGDLLAVRTAGAYGAVMASTYNTRPLAPEVLVDGEDYAVIRRRFTVQDMLDLETLPPWLDSGTGAR